MSAATIEKHEYETWLTPRQARAALDDLGTAYRIVDALNTRVRSGLMRIAAEFAKSSRMAERVSYLVISPELWGEPDSNAYFWSTSDIQFTTRSPGYGNQDVQWELFGVRFDPAGIDAIRRASGLVTLPNASQADRTPTQAEYLEAIKALRAEGGRLPSRTGREPAFPGADPPPADRKPLTESEAKRFCAFLLSEKPDATMRDAHARAIGFYHDRKVPRDWFWSIFRTIQGPRAPVLRQNHGISREHSYKDRTILVQN
jgi:hypothetical protein